MKTIVVTGASAGIGLAVADRFATGGWQVAIIARNQTRLDDAADMLRKHGRKVVPIAADASDAEAMGAAANRIEHELGPIDAWVNNAMSMVVARAWEITSDEYTRVTATTYLSQVYGSLAALRHMRVRNRGVIVQISSALAFRAAPLQAAYCGAKAAVSGFTDALRAELIADRSSVSLSVVYLPGVNTPQPTWSRNRSGHEQIIPDPVDPRLCAEAVWATVGNPQCEVWVGRTTALMAIGQRIAPSFSDRRAASMVEQQQGAPMAPRAGNLDATVDGPALIDGPAGDKVRNLTGEFFTSRSRDALQASAIVGLMGAGALTAFGLSRLLPRALR